MRVWIKKFCKHCKEITLWENGHCIECYRWEVTKND